MPEKIVIVGNGIVGLGNALHLRRAGHDVTVVDRTPLDEGTSTGNAGGVAGAAFLPIPEPGLWKTVPALLLNPLGPLSIRWRDLGKLAPWLYQFLRACRPDAYRRGIEAMGNLMSLAGDAHLEMLEATGLKHLLRQSGVLFVYRSEASCDASAASWQHRARHGFDCQRLGRAGIRNMEPALGEEAQAGYFVPSWWNYRDPKELLIELAAHLRQCGVEFQTGNVAGFDIGTDGPVAVRFDDGATLAFDRVVICAGAWSGRLSAMLGEPFSIVADRGYNTTLPNPGIEIGRTIDFAEDSFVITPMSMGYRVGGAVELASPETPPNYARCEALLTLAKRYLPELNVEGGSQWMGCRPSTPDSVPVISRSAKHGNVFYCFGHGHLGLTGSMVSGRLIGHLMAGETPNIDMAPYRIDRFR